MRKFSLVMLVLCGFLAIGSGPCGADGTYVTYTVAGNEYEGFAIQGPPFAPSVLLLHDWDGLTEYEVNRAGMIAKRGYTVFAADLFGKGIRPTQVVDKRAHTGELYKDRQKLRDLILGALSAATKEVGFQQNNAVCIGYCFGGAAALELARSGAPFRGFVTFHGGLRTPEHQSYSMAQGEYLILHGGADGVVTMDDFVTLSEELEESKRPHEMIVYGGAPHAFTVPGSNGYRQEADRKSWARFLTFLKRVTHPDSVPK